MTFYSQYTGENAVITYRGIKEDFSINYLGKNWLSWVMLCRSLRKYE